MAQDRESDVEQLNSFLRGERSAVDTYAQCIEKVTDPEVLSTLAILKRSHQERVHQLSELIVSLGGSPSKDSGLWGSFAEMVQGSAKALGTKAAIAALEEGEDHGRNDYQRDLDDLTPTTRDFIAANILPEQKRSHDVLSRLKSQL